MKCIYYLDHDQRYAHVHPKDRWMYPDEIKLGDITYKREKNHKDITPDEARAVLSSGVTVLLIAKDVPYTEACYK